MNYFASRKKFVNRLLWSSVPVYACMMAYLLLFKYTSPLELFSPERYMFRSVNLVPLRGIAEYLFGGITSASLVRYNVFGNILIFIPLGLLIPLMRPKQTAVRTVGIICLASAAVEATQYILGLGSTDIDDVILNTLGGLIGVLIFMGLHRGLGGRDRVKALISVMSALCAVLVIAVFGPIWARSIYWEQIRAGWNETYGMDLQQADISGTYLALEDDTVIVSGPAEILQGKTIRVGIGPETKVSIVRRTQEGAIDSFEPMDEDFFERMQETGDLSIWIELQTGAQTPKAEAGEGEVPPVAYLVGHHHTYDEIDGMDYQILVEADFLVNAYEDEMAEPQIRAVVENLFQTETGKRYCQLLYM